MKRFMLAGCALMALAGVAFAQDADPMTPRYGNTLVVKDAKGLEARMFYNADHSWSGTMMDGAAMKGTWELKDGKLCNTQTDPAPAADMPNPRCRDFVAHNVGDTWTINTPNGEMTATIVQGR